MEVTALIMAGGHGERFWPRSRKSLPKQFLSLTEDGKTMIQLTVERILPLVAMDNIFIATSRDYEKLVKKQLPDLPEENILCEPIGKNTAPCIGLGAVHIANKYPDALMLVLPSDHLIKYNSMFQTSLKEACRIAEKEDNLVTIGITPDYPETGYGYIKFDSQSTEGQAYAVDRFVEKPSLELAKEYIATEEYLWNSGMFVWKVSSILDNMKKFIPDTYAGLQKIKEHIGKKNYEEELGRIFSGFTSISIDYAIMEKAKNIFTIPGSFGWDDVGSWLAIERIKKSNELGNVVSGNVITVQSRNCIIEGDRKLIATVGVSDLVIVDTEDATLVCQKNATNDIKKVIENLKICNRSEYL